MALVVNSAVPVVSTSNPFVEGILKLLSEAGSGFDIVSGGELDRVLRIGADPSKIVFSGVGKQVGDYTGAQCYKTFFSVENLDVGISP